MKKSDLLILLTICLSGCTSNATAFNVRKTQNAINPITKTEIKQTYKDYYEHSPYNSGQTPTKGDVNILVIPVWFLDTYTTYNIDSLTRYGLLEGVEKAFFGTKEELGCDSVKSFYETESHGALTLNGKVTQWFECEHFSWEFSSGGSESKLVPEAVEWYFENNPDDDRLKYDSDKDGYLDGVCLIYSMPNYMHSGSEITNFWAHRNSVCNASLKDINNPGPNSYMWASWDYVYSSGYGLASEGIGYGETTWSKYDTHTYIHEFGHMLGVPDYYDYNDTQRRPAGGFSMQDMNVGGHDPYSVMAFGWADPYIPKESCTLKIGAFQSTHDIILLTPNWNEYDSVFDEYLLLELYTPTGLNEFDSKHPYRSSQLIGESYPSGPSNTGIRLWHVDARLTQRIDNGEYSIPRYSWSNNLTSDATLSNVHEAISNTHYLEGGDKNDHCSVLGSEYYNFEFLQLIYRDVDSDDLLPIFFEGFCFDVNHSFTVSQYQDRFANPGKFDNNIDIGWSFIVDSIEGEGNDAVATVRLIKE